MTWVSTKSVGDFLQRRHYLGPVRRGFAWSDEFGVMVFAKPTARRLPNDGTWFELVRWWSDNNIGQAPAGAVAALGLCLEAIARLTHERDALFGKLAEVLDHE